MNLKLMFVLSFVFSLNCFAQFSSTSPSQTQQECNIKVQGGDYFPWSVAKPFPWSDIQGVWKLSDGIDPLYLKAKIIRTTTNKKILNLSIVSEGNCNKPVARGLGYIDFSDRNVVRAIMNDGVSKYQMKLAYFDVKDLEIDSKACGDNVMAASLRLIGSMHLGENPKFFSSDHFDGPENIMLRKTSDDLNSICKKLGSQ